MADDPMINGARLRVFSDAMATPIVKKNATAYGGTESSWAFAAEYPSSLMIVGRKSDKVYSGKDIVWNPSPYSQTLGSLNASRTADQVNSSSRVASLSFFRRNWMNSLSSFDRNSAVEG